MITYEEYMSRWSDDCCEVDEDLEESIKTDEAEERHQEEKTRKDCRG